MAKRRKMRRIGENRFRANKNPKKYTSAKLLTERTAEYFDHILGEETQEWQEYQALPKVEKDIVPVPLRWVKAPEPPTLTGLTLYLGFATTKSLEHYYKKEGYEEFHDIIGRARTVIENYHELRIAEERNVTGSIFALKNMGWKDRMMHGSDPENPITPEEQKVTVQFVNGTGEDK